MRNPTGPITEIDFVDDKCGRCSYIYKFEDAWYYNDRVVVFKKSYDGSIKIET